MRRDAPVPCDDCGTELVTGFEAITREDDPEAWAAGEDRQAVDWCPNLACPSNTAFRGFHRTGVDRYRCLRCGETVAAPMSAVRAHRSSHAQR